MGGDQTFKSTAHRSRRREDAPPSTSGNPNSPLAEPSRPSVEDGSSSARTAAPDTSDGVRADRPVADNPLSASTSCVPPLSGLWEEAYGQLRSSRPRLILEYEALLPDKPATQQKPERYAQLQRFVLQSSDEIEKGGWKVRFRDHEFLVKDFVEHVVGVVACMLCWLPYLFASDSPDRYVTRGQELCCGRRPNFARGVSGLGRCLSNPTGALSLALTLRGLGGP